MDFQNRVGSKTGGGGPASYSESNRDRRERLAALAAETIDLAKVSTLRNLLLNDRALSFIFCHLCL